MSVDGPGQGEAEYDLAIRPDWEVPGTAIIDAACALPGIDAGRIGIWGVSLGGYYAARVAGGDHRVRATIALCGPYCLGDIWDQLPELSRAAFTVRSKSGSDEQARAAASQLSLDGVGAKITAPLLIIAGQRDRIFPWQDAERLHQEVGQNSELMLLPDGNHGCANVTYKHRQLRRRLDGRRPGLAARPKQPPANQTATHDYHRGKFAVVRTTTNFPRGARDPGSCCAIHDRGEFSAGGPYFAGTAAGAAVEPLTLSSGAR